MVDKWDVFTTWQCVLPPSRPDNWQLSIIKEHLTAYKKPVVAVLGATIEFRDLLAECNISKVYVFEKNHHYFTEISQYRKYKNDEILSCLFPIHSSYILCIYVYWYIWYRKPRK